MLSLLTRLLHPTPATPRRRPPLPHRAAVPGADGEADADERPFGCGWFDSSHELLSGITVWEGIIVVDPTAPRPT
jgi:hypothetical protein